MARFMGKDGAVSVGGNVVAEVQGFDVSDERATARAPSLGQAYVGHGVGSPAWTGVVRCMLDASDTTGQGALKGTGSLALILQPQGVGAGLPQISFASVYTSSVATVLTGEEFVTIEFNFVADSAADETPQT